MNSTFHLRPANPHRHMITTHLFSKKLTARSVCFGKKEMNRILTPVGGLDKNFLCKTEYLGYEIVLVPCQNEEKRKLRNKFR